MVAPRFESSALPGVGLLVTPFHSDRRGSFTKPYAPDALAAAGIDMGVAEVYWSSSHPGTVRGLHFQTPPTAVAKIVFAVTGRVTDVVVDLRVGSPTYGQHARFDLTPGAGSVVVPVGCAHGFEVVGDDDAVLCYLQDVPFDPATDAGVRWDSAGIAWETTEPITSDRDAGLPRLEEFASPFVWDAA
ncbi:dTDP-4-dehydrorhamnose 3,5-epimerase family protein [Cellulomonas shaoxiangyii]|uniref:dTDP-4-dehydrorhamnose 3,5-epimerase family protein n=1 Tax=Cellulomonas shaoxiangyii TaxID=2566013 RepID=UPI001AA020C7|nr:dTDP-4-dehydrorhamnose 3,5-epimerase family protein [Cellulomonas shaoxiangyii]